MSLNVQLILNPEEAFKDECIKLKLAENLGVSVDAITFFRVTKRSIDARSANTKVHLTVDYAFDDKDIPEFYTKTFDYQDVRNKKPIFIIGAGPAGLFAALKLIELGLKPIVFERGKGAVERYKDVVQINQNIALNPNSNYSFGAGGGGMFSDGKLYTRSKKKGGLRELLETFHYHGAPDDILIDGYPHVGYDLLPQIISKLCDTITSHGGEIHFEKKLVDIILEDNKLTGIKLDDGTEYQTDYLLLATGGSAHDIYELLDKKGIEIEAKDFAIGVRVEHPQHVIDRIQYKTVKRNSHLPPASYNLVEQVNGRAVYSFCMCPGGKIVHAGNNEKSIVVNGISSSQRNSDYANSGIVVAIRQEDIPDKYYQYGVFAGLKFQEDIEHKAYIENDGNKLKAPAQRLMDFVFSKASTDLPSCSYEAGVVPSALHQWLPKHIASRLQIAFQTFDRKMRGFLSQEAIVVGVETRSTSCIRIPRNTETGEHIRIKGLYPVGEGSGYSGGITSSALDGEHAAYHVFAAYQSSKETP